MTADYAARVRTLAARHNREWQLLVEEMDRERTTSLKCGERCLRPDCRTRHRCKNPGCPVHGHAEAEEHA